MKYQVIYADPPWHYETYDKRNAFGRDNRWSVKGRATPYTCMSLEDLKRLPIQEMASDDCALFIWVISPLLPQALELIESWGFTYKTKAFCWVKTTGLSGLHWGLGHWTRANTEDCLLATKGHPKRLDKGIHQVIMSDVLDHSHKPAIAREKIVQLMGDLPRIELFARRKVDGWDCWGNEVKSDIVLATPTKE